MLSTQTDYRARQLPTGVRIQRPEGPKIDVGIKDDTVTLQGDGFAHSIQVTGDTVTVSSLDGKHQTSFPKLAYLEGSQRVAVGVAASLLNVPVNLLTGEKSEPVYLNLANRMGMGIRSNGNREGGRYRVTEMERGPNGRFNIHTKNGSISKGEGQYNSTPTAYLKSQSGMPLEMNGAFRRLTGTTYGEAFSSNITEYWQKAGKPGDAVQAVEVANYMFDLAFKAEPGYNMYRPETAFEPVGETLHGKQPEYLSTEQAARTWSVLSEAAANGSDAETLLKALKR